MPDVDWNNPDSACAEYKRLDAKFNTDPFSPLHHDVRCVKCVPFMVEHLVFVSVP